MRQLDQSFVLVTETCSDLLRSIFGIDGREICNEALNCVKETGELFRRFLSLGTCRVLNYCDVQEALQSLHDSHSEDVTCQDCSQSVAFLVKDVASLLLHYEDDICYLLKGMFGDTTPCKIIKNDHHAYSSVLTKLFIKNNILSVCSGCVTIAEEEDPTIGSGGDNEDPIDENNLNLIVKEPGDLTFEIYNYNEGAVLAIESSETGQSDSVVLIDYGDIGQEDRQWFFKDGMIVAGNGRVLQSNGLGGAVSLEVPSQDRLLQQRWKIRRQSRYKHHITNQNGDLGCIMENRQKIVGMVDPDEVGICSMWKIKFLGDI